MIQSRQIEAESQLGIKNLFIVAVTFFEFNERTVYYAMAYLVSEIQSSVFCVHSKAFLLSLYLIDVKSY